VTLTGQLLEDGNPATPIAGRTLKLTIGGQTCNGVTDGSGNASCSLTYTGPLGPTPVAASFAGDAFYLPSSDTGKPTGSLSESRRIVPAMRDAAGRPVVGTVERRWSLVDTISGGPGRRRSVGSTVSLPTTTPLREPPRSVDDARVTARRPSA
jgi:hypothetical protein